jgi:hypothetical protein
VNAAEGRTITSNAHIITQERTTHIPSFPIRAYQQVHCVWCISSPLPRDSIRPALFASHSAKLQQFASCAKRPSPMLFDERFIGANATQQSRENWADDVWPQIKLIWTYLILLHFARLLPLDPVVIHWLSVLLRKVSDSAAPVITSIPEHYEL